MPLSEYSHEQLVELMLGIALDGKFARRSQMRLANMDGSAETYHAKVVFESIAKAGATAQDWLDLWNEESDE